jgi:hypothetical protein
MIFAEASGLLIVHGSSVKLLAFGIGSNGG